jgi:acetolactate synthase-1/2/3 large subunit
MYTTATALLEALQEAGVSYLFANLGSDHPAIVESIAEAKATGRTFPMLITCPNEMVALSAAQGYAQATGRAQAVLVHVECGTQALAGAVHNAAKARVPVLLLAGTSPMTQEGELRGTRNEFVHWIQDVFDQRGLVRGYVKYDNEIRTGRNVKQIVFRALQLAHSDPPGPVYLMAAREVLEEEVPRVSADPSSWQKATPGALVAEDVAAIAAELITCRRPLVVTSYLGRKPEAVSELLRLCRRLGIGVLDSVPNYMNYPADDALYQGIQMNEPRQNPVLGEADVVVVLDSDVPWIPLVNRPRVGAKIFHIDVDPLKEQMPLWYIPATRLFRADAATALRQINEHLETAEIDARSVEQRHEHYAALHETRQKEVAAREEAPDDVINAEYLSACVRKHMDADTVVLNEGITNHKAILDHLQLTLPGSMFTSGATALGWNGGAAIGCKLAWPDKTVVSLTGDGSYMFSVPSAVHWIARHYQTPFVQIVYNNRGWRSPKLSALAVHPDGYASKGDDVGFHFDPPPDYAGIAAAAGGAWARTVHHPLELERALEEAFQTVRQEKRAAVLDVWLPPL